MGADGEHLPSLRHLKLPQRTLSTACLPLEPSGVLDGRLGRPAPTLVLASCTPRSTPGTTLNR